MKLNLSSLECLSEHSKYLKKIFEDQQLFVVWWTLRDLLLWRTHTPIDIDVTWKWDPDQIRENMFFDESIMSRFRTEKYWTMTVIPKETQKNASVTYEYTPFRAESEYSDNRHPDSIQRSDSLVADSARRDFTINAIYWTGVKESIQTIPTPSLPTKSPFTHCLEKQLPVIFSKYQCIILTNHDHIETFVTSWALPKQWVFLTETPDWYRAEKLIQASKLVHCIIDPQWWIRDLMKRSIKTVWDPATRYKEDALRLMRGLRFANTLNQWLEDSAKQNSGFDFEKRTREQLAKHHQLIQNVAAERHYQELFKVFNADNPFGYISTLKTAWLLKYLFPALADTINNHQPTRHHALDTFSHTLMVLYHIQQRCADPLVKFAVLYHDVWKPEQYAFMERAKALNPENPDREWFKHHAEISVPLAHRDFKALNFPKSSLETVCRYIRYHHRPWEILDSNPNRREQKIRKLMSDGWYTETLQLIDIAIADRMWQYNPLQSPAIQELLDMQDTVHALYAAEWRFVMKNLVVNWKRLMDNFELSPGPQLWDLLGRIFEWVLGDVEWRNNEKEIWRLVEGLLKSN